MERSNERYGLRDFVIGDGRLTVLAGPCSLESPELGLEVARTIASPRRISGRKLTAPGA